MSAPPATEGIDLAVDFHTHLLFGIDDGSRGPVETVAMARGLAAQGVHLAFCTPHRYRFGLDWPPERLSGWLTRVRELLRTADVALEIAGGAEHQYGDDLLRALAANEEIPTLAHAGRRHLLVELPIRRPVVGVRNTADLIRRRDLVPVMAHPERCTYATTERMAGWRKAGWLFQLDLASLVGAYGGTAEQRSHELLERGAYAFAGSDLHRPAQLDRVARAKDLLREVLGVAGKRE